MVLDYVSVWHEYPKVWVESNVDSRGQICARIFTTSTWKWHSQLSKRRILEQNTKSVNFDGHGRAHSSLSDLGLQIRDRKRPNYLTLRLPISDGQACQALRNVWSIHNISFSWVTLFKISDIFDFAVPGILMMQNVIYINARCSQSRIFRHHWGHWPRHIYFVVPFRTDPLTNQVESNMMPVSKSEGANGPFRWHALSAIKNTHFSNEQKRRSHLPVSGATSSSTEPCRR